MPGDLSIQEPTFVGFVESTYDALLIFEACLQNRVRKITRRLHEKERHLIASGSCFVFCEKESGIKRWTDNLFWSPSRILGNFLIYRELDKKESNVQGSQISLTAQQIASDDLPVCGASNRASSVDSTSTRERSLLGSLTSSYKFKANGLVKKTISVAGMHMICYYRVNDVVQGRLRNPSSLPELSTLEISPLLFAHQSFRVQPKIEIGADGQQRFAGEVDDGASYASHALSHANSFSNLTVPFPPEPRRRASAGDQDATKFAYHAPVKQGMPYPYREVSNQAVTQNARTVPSRPSVARASSGGIITRASRYDPYSRNDVLSSYGAAPINLQETGRRRTPPNPVVPLADITGHQQYSHPSMPSPADSSGSSGFDTSPVSHYTALPHPASAPTHSYLHLQDSSLAHNVCQSYPDFVQTQAKPLPPHFRPLPPQPFQLPSESSSLRSTASVSPYYSQSFPAGISSEASHYQLNEEPIRAASVAPVASGVTEESSFRAAASTLTGVAQDQHLAPHAIQRQQVAPPIRYMSAHHQDSIAAPAHYEPSPAKIQAMHSQLSAMPLHNDGPAFSLAQHPNGMVVPSHSPQWIIREPSPFEMKAAYEYEWPGALPYTPQ